MSLRITTGEDIIVRLQGSTVQYGLLKIMCPLHSTSQ